MDSQHLSPHGYIALSCYLGFLLFVGTISQTITFKVLLLKQNRKKHLTPYLINIVVSNIMVIGGSFPTTFVSSLRNGWNFSDAVCRVSGLLAGIGCIAMIFTMTCITVKIYFLVKNQNHIANQINVPQNDRLHWKILAAIWIYALIAMAPPIVGLTDMELEAARTNCVPVWAPKRMSDKIYIVILTFMAYLLPVGVSIIFLWKTRLILSLHISLMHNRFMNLRVGKLKNIYRMSATAVLVFTLSWLPYGLYVIVSLIAGKNIFSVELTMVPALTAKTSVIVNPFIYAIVLPRFRLSVWEIFRIRRKAGGDSPDISDADRPGMKLLLLRVNQTNRETCTNPNEDCINPSDTSRRNRMNINPFSPTTAPLNENNSKSSKDVAFKLRHEKAIHITSESRPIRRKDPSETTL